MARYERRGQIVCDERFEYVARSRRSGTDRNGIPAAPGRLWLPYHCHSPRGTFQSAGVARSLSQGLPETDHAGDAIAKIAGWASKNWNGAGEGNRTLVFSFEGCCSTIELLPRSRSPNTPC